MNKRGGGEKVLNLETVKYELKVLVTKDDGDLIKIVPNSTDYCNAKIESLSFNTYLLWGFHTIYMSKSDTSNKLLQFFPVEIFGNMKRLLLKWTYHAMERLPLEIFMFEDLQELTIQSTEGRNLGSHVSHLPQVIGDMKNLRILEISTFKYLEDLPSEISNLDNLEELVIYRCKSLLRLPSEIGDLKRLRRLDISWCSELEDLPSTISNLESLEKLSVKYCYRLTQFPSETNNWKQLRELIIGDIAERWNGIDNFRLGCTNLVNLQEMEIAACGNLVNLPQEIGNLRCLEKLWIEHCNNLENLPSAIGILENLQEMVINTCCRINDLPPEIGNLRCLRKLEITTENWDEPVNSIPMEVGNLLSLQEFAINYGGCLERMALVINKLERHLQKLYIDYYIVNYNPSYLFDVQFKMTLEELEFQNVDTIENVNDFLQSLAAEKSLSSPMSLFLPQGIRCIKIENPAMVKGNINQETMCKLLQKYPTIARICSDEGKILNDLSAGTLHLMYLNRFGVSLQHDSSTAGDRSPLTSLAENVWPIILEEVKTRIRNDFIDVAKRTTLKNPTSIGASVIYSILRELLLPLLFED